jgi:selenoprotein W-related protein
MRCSRNPKARLRHERPAAWKKRSHPQSSVAQRQESNTVNANTRPRIAITYCTQCQWLLRAAWMAQELLSTFGTDLGEVALVPGTGGIFQVHCDGILLWDRKARGGFPDAKALKQAVRDQVDPGRDLGHVDRERHE